MPILDFLLERDFIELNQLLKLTGLCDSGGAGKQLVAGDIGRRFFHGVNLEGWIRRHL